MRRSSFAAGAPLTTTKQEGGAAMVEKANANSLLFGKVHGEQLEITAFKYNGKIITVKCYVDYNIIIIKEIINY